MSEKSDTQVFLFPLAALQPSQLYINQDKLNTLQESIDFSDLSAVPPLPIKKLKENIVIMDGHTRAYAAYLAGHKRVPVFWDQDDLDWEAYQICVDWCQDEGIHSIDDLQSRMLSPEAYEELWHQRCRVMQSELAESRK